MISKLKYKNKNYFQTEKLSKSNHRFDIHLLLDYLQSTRYLKYFGDDLYFPVDGFETDSCKTTRYKNLLYVHNFFDLDSTAGQRIVIFYVYVY